MIILGLGSLLTWEETDQKVVIVMGIILTILLQAEKVVVPQIIRVYAMKKYVLSVHQDTIQMEEMLLAPNAKKGRFQWRMPPSAFIATNGIVTHQMETLLEFEVAK